MKVCEVVADEERAAQRGPLIVNSEDLF